MNAVDTDLVDDIDDDEDDDKEKRPLTQGLGFLGIVAVTLALLLKAFFVQAFFIPSGSMERTLHGCTECKGDRVLVNKLVYRFRDIHRGEVVVFNGKGTSFTSESPTIPPPKNVVDKVMREARALVGFGAPGDKDFIKRVIGIPGDVVACCTNGKVTVNGQPLDEPYVWLDGSTNPSNPQPPFVPKNNDDLPRGCRPALETCTPGLEAFAPVKVPPGQLFLMGDHRDGSSDSRIHGTVPESKVVGRAFAVFYPRGRMKVLRVPATFDPTKQHPQSQGEPPDPVAVPQLLALAAVVPVTLVRRRVRRRTD